jgi:hypothetical protein
MKEPETYWGHTRGEFWTSLEKVFGLARHQIWLFDNAFDDWPLESKSTFDILTHSMLRIQTATVADVPVNVLVQQPDWLEKNGIRFKELRKRFSAHIELRLVPQEYWSAESVAIVDQQHAVIRPHKNAYRSKTVIAQPSELENRLAKLRQIHALSTACLPVTTLGL